MNKHVIVFDLDGTVIDSSHRTPTHKDGTLNLTRYLEMQVREHIFKDNLLPLASVMQKLHNMGHYIIICTARIMSQDDIDFLHYHKIPYHSMQSRLQKEDGIKDAILKHRKLTKLKNLPQFRNKHWIMFEDAKPVISAMRKIGITCLNAVKVNERLTKCYM